MIKIKLIIGSTRTNRFGPKPAQWLFDLAQQIPDVDFELVDLAKVNLPLAEIPAPPMMGGPHPEHAKDWARLIGEADGFVFITPEYNHSFPASLKNAIDYLNREWAYKPATYLSYGADAGGTRAVDHLRSFAGQLQMYDLREAVTIANYWGQLDEQGNFNPTEQQEQSARVMLEAIVFWATHLKPAREALAKS